MPLYRLANRHPAPTKGGSFSVSSSSLLTSSMPSTSFLMLSLLFTSSITMWAAVGIFSLSIR